MGLGLSSLLLACIGLMIAMTNARPSESLEASDWSTEWQQVADLWMPKTDKDKWRAFAPEKEVSNTKWWEGKLDDDLWNLKAHESTTQFDKPAEIQTTKPQAVITDIPAPESPNLVTKSQSPSIVETTSTTSVKTTSDVGFGEPSFKKGEVNTFIDPDPETYYRSSGENYRGKFWVPLNSEPDHKVDPAISQKSGSSKATQNNKSIASQVNENHNAVPESDLHSDYLQSDEPKQLKYYEEPHTSEEDRNNNKIDVNNVLMQEPFHPKASQANTALNSSPKDEEGVDVDISKNDAPQERAQTSQVRDTPFNKANVSNDVITDKEKNIPLSYSMSSIASSEKREKLISDKKNGESIVADANAIYGKGERLAGPRVSATKIQLKEGTAIGTTSGQGKQTAVKTDSEFSDWKNWDSSVFDYYDDAEDKDEDRIVIENKPTTSTAATSFSETKNKNKINDEIDNVADENDYSSDEDADDEDDTDYDDDGYASDNVNREFEVKQEKKQPTTVLPISQVNKNKNSSKTVENVRESVVNNIENKPFRPSIQSQSTDNVKEASLETDIPNHKPSVKKDLTNPSNIKKDENTLVSSNIPKSINANNNDRKNTSINSDQSQYIQPNATSDVLPISKLSPSRSQDSKEHSETTPINNINNINKALANLGTQKSDVSKGFVLSFPLEFCKIDNECRAGRMCVVGVCRCYTANMCAGHHKPICGSDGFQYPSHCELHRVACVNRIHIRADRRGKCFQKEIEDKEKSWLMEQERLMHLSLEKDKSLIDNIQIPSYEIIQFPQNMTKGTEKVDTKRKRGSKKDKATVKASTTATTTTATTTTTTTIERKSSATDGKKECSWKEMAEFKEALLMFYCQKFAEPNCNLEVKTDREYLSMLMFSYCDKDYDYFLTAKELDDKERHEHFNKNILLNCHLHDFIKYADNLEADGKLTVSEFTSAFEAPIPDTPPHVQIEVIPTLASAGNGLELKCGIDAANIVWKRHGTQLSDDKRSHQLMVFDDGALFFSTVGLHHIGNYTCMDANDETKAQIHRLKVQTMPVIEVMPAIQTHITGSDIELKCHAEGVPKPMINWKHGGQILLNSPHTTLYYGGGHMVIHNAQIKDDVGTYTCSAHSQAGTLEKSVSVNILPLTSASTKESSKEVGTFVVFHSKGISAYDPLRCLLRHQVPGDFSNFKYIPDNLDAPLTLCQKGKVCQWGESVTVGSKFIYVCQPDQDRVVVMSAGDNWNPLQVIDTDKRPEKLWYVKHLDQVWVLCGSQEHGEGNKTIVVIRDASQHIQHRSVHTQPVGNHFDMVLDLFIAPPNDLKHEFSFGYVSHRSQNGLFKLSLEDMSYTKAIDLTNYGCVPTNIAFVPIGGHVVIQCVSATDQHTLQLIMDYLTDSITSTTSLNGHPMTSPDSRHLVTVDKFTGKVTVTSVSDEGVLETTYEVTVSASISDVAFMPAMSHQGYDLVLTSAADDDVIIMNLVTGKVEKITGSHYSEPANTWHPSAIHRHIISGNSMNSYLMAPSRSSLAILDAKFKQVECEFMESAGNEVMIYIPSSNVS